MKKIARSLASVIAVLLLVGLSTKIAEAKFIELPEFDPANFVLVVDNPYFPLVPKTTFVYEAETEDESIVDTVTVTDQIKVILDVTCTVVHDVEMVNGVKTEETFDWYAQDHYGSVWYFGEDTTEFLYDEEGNPIGTSKEGSWKAGIDGALPGIIMLEDPQPGLAYQQEFYEDVAEDMALVLRLNDFVSVEFDDFDNCLVTKEWTPLELGSVEQKFYAPGLGLVLVLEHHGKIVRFEMVDVTHEP
ncbi:MAG: hypothetical protein HYX78_00545 [Armatimonadetes bacterium]|nr:hypothetical protein [Armatimonadota bacterium]